MRRRSAKTASGRSVKSVYYGVRMFYGIRKRKYKTRRPYGRTALLILLVSATLSMMPFNTLQVKAAEPAAQTVDLP